MLNKFWQRIFSLCVLSGLIFSVVSPVADSRAAVTDENKPMTDQDPFAPSVILPVKSDMSPALLEITPAQMEPVNETSLPLYQLPKVVSTNTTETHEAAGVQTAMGPEAMPAPLLNFEGVSNLDNPAKVYPPDTEGDIGPNHYVQWVNLSFAIWAIDKINNTATKVYGPVPGNTLFTGFGAPCETTNNGDPITLYDPLADRWLMSQFALPNYPSGPFYQCIAISLTGNPTGAWYRYAYTWPGNLLNDYSKFGVWPDAYYMTANQFNPNFAGAGVAAFNRGKMMAGDPSAEMVYFNLYSINPHFGGILPADFDGLTPPPAGAPALFAEWDDSTWLGDPTDSLRIWKFHVDWGNTANSTFGLSGLPNYIIPTINVDPNMCNYARNCIPQPGTSVKVDAISDRLMYRLQYRNFGGYQTLVSNHTVDATGTDNAGIHWFELRDYGSGWAMNQEGVFHPDSNNRWMGSAALDHTGNLALGYSLSSSTVYPSIRYAGRLVGDPLGTLPQAEVEIIAGTGSQTGSAYRWGDYSMMGVDPVDDCTFWYTQEYIQTTGPTLWQTRVTAFKFPGCSLLTYEPKAMDVTLEMGNSTTVPITLTSAGITPLHWYLQEESKGFTPMVNVPAYIPPPSSIDSAQSLSQFAEPEVSGKPDLISAPTANMLLNQPPNRSNGYFSDSDCNVCGTGKQSIAENFNLPGGGTISKIIFWTGYHPSDTPMATDSITVIFHANSAGLPGVALYTEANVAYTRVQTGVILFGVHEWIHTLTLASPVVLGPGNYWVEIYNNTSANSDSFFWEFGNIDPIAGLLGSAVASATPGTSWSYSSGVNLAIQLVAGIVDVPWLSESPVAGTLPASVPDTLTTNAPQPEATPEQSFLDAQDTVNSPIPTESGEPSEIGLASIPYAPTSILYDNGPLVTHPGGGAGAADASALQSALGMNIYGFGHSLLSNFRIADDFIISDSSWQIDSITFYAYQTGSSTASTINHVNLRIWNGMPGAPGSSIIWGDTSTNRLTNTIWSRIYRVLDTGLSDTTRPVMADTVAVGITLPAGHYWLDWQTGGSTLLSGPWAPPISIPAQTTTGNGLQSSDNGSIWTPVSDVGPQGFPFIIKGTVNQVVQVTFDAGVPEVDQPGIYSAQLIINSEPPYIVQNLPITMHVITYGVDLAPDAIAKTGLPGNTVTYDVTITNTSHGISDSFDLSISGNTFTTQLSAVNTPMLDPGQSATVQVKVTVPTVALAGAQDKVTVKAVFHSKPVHSASIDLTTTTGAVYIVELTPAADGKEAKPGAIATYTLHVVNMGNHEDTISFSVTGNLWSVAFSVPSVTLAAGDGADMVVLVTVPAGAAYHSMDNAVIHATSQGNAAVSDQSTLTTTAGRLITFLPLVNKH